MDWATGKVLAWRLSNTLDASFCVEALNEAIAKHGKPEIMNTDQGSQFTGAAWITTLTEADRGRNCRLPWPWNLKSPNSGPRQDFSEIRP